MGYKIKWVDNNIHGCFDNCLTYSNLEKLRNELWTDKRFDTLDYAIYDLRKVVKVELTNDELNIVATLDRTASIWSRRKKQAFIANNPKVIDAVLIYISHMNQINWEIEIFDDFEKGLSWCKS